MVYLRSEAHLERWLGETGYEPGATFSAAKLNDLAQRWWGSRLDPDWRPRMPAASQAILDDLGFTGPFWQLG